MAEQCVSHNTESERGMLSDDAEPATEDVTPTQQPHSHESSDQDASEEADSEMEVGVSTTVPDVRSFPDDAVAALNEEFTQSSSNDLITLVTQQGEVQVECVGLVACSSYFRALVNSGMRETCTNTVQLKDVSNRVIHSIVCFAHFGRTNLNDGNVEDLMMAACRFQIDKLKEECISHLVQELSAENCLGFSRFGKTLDCDSLVLAADNYTNSHFQTVSEDEEFLELSLDEVTNLLSHDDIIVDSEDKVYCAMVRWLEHQPASAVCGDQRARLLRAVRLPLVTRRFLTAHVTDAPLWRGCQQCQQMVRDAVEYTSRSPSWRSQSISLNCKPRRSRVKGIMQVGTHCTYLDLQDLTWKNVAHPQTTSSSAQQMRLFPNHKLAQIGDKVYQLGGMSDKNQPGDHSSQYTDVMAYNLRTDTWSLAATTRGRVCLGARAAACSVGDAVYVTGGDVPIPQYRSTVLTNTAQSSMFLRFRPDSPIESRFLELPPMKMARSGHSMVYMDGELYVCGGRKGSYAIAECEKYSFATNRWELMARLPVGRMDMGLVAVGGELYALGGRGTHRDAVDSVDRYDPDHNVWAPHDTLPFSMFNMRCVAAGSSIWILGTSTYTTPLPFDASEPIYELSYVMEYEPLAQKWTRHRGLPAVPRDEVVAIHHYD